MTGLSPSSSLVTMVKKSIPKTSSQRMNSNFLKHICDTSLVMCCYFLYDLHSQDLTIP